jgi:hypothetical protein
MLSGIGRQSKRIASTVQHMRQVNDERRLMKIYQLGTDANRYQNLVLANGDDWEVFDRFTGQPQADGWVPVAVEVLRDDEQNRSLPAGDFPALASHVPVFSRKAAECLFSLLETHGELLPLQCSEGDYCAFNVTRILDALDIAHSEVLRFDDGELMQIVRPAFRPDEIRGVPIFKLVEVPEMDVFVSEEFREAAETAGLKGFDFREVWALPIH